MARYRTEVTSPAAPGDVFAYLADFSNAQEWDPGVSRAERVDDGLVGPGSEFDLDVGFAGRTTTMRYEVVAYDHSERIMLRSTTPLFTSEDTITVRPAGDGSVATYDAVLKLRGPLRLADPLLSLAFKKIGDDAAAGLRDHLRRLPVGGSDR